MQEDSLIHGSIPTVCLLPTLSPCQLLPVLFFRRVPMLPAQSDLLHTLILKHDLQHKVQSQQAQSQQINRALQMVCHGRSWQSSGFRQGIATVPKPAMPHCSQLKLACSLLSKQHEACSENEAVGFLTHLLDESSIERWLHSLWLLVALWCWGCTHVHLCHCCINWLLFKPARQGENTIRP